MFDIMQISQICDVIDKNDGECVLSFLSSKLLDLAAEGIL